MKRVVQVEEFQRISLEMGPSTCIQNKLKQATDSVRIGFIDELKAHDWKAVTENNSAIVAQRIGKHEEVFASLLPALALGHGGLNTPFFEPLKENLSILRKLNVVPTPAYIGSMYKLIFAWLGPIRHPRRQRLVHSFSPPKERIWARNSSCLGEDIISFACLL